MTGLIMRRSGGGMRRHGPGGPTTRLLLRGPHGASGTAGTVTGHREGGRNQPCGESGQLWGCRWGRRGARAPLPPSPRGRIHRRRTTLSEFQAWFKGVSSAGKVAASGPWFGRKREGSQQLFARLDFSGLAVPLHALTRYRCRVPPGRPSSRRWQMLRAGAGLETRVAEGLLRAGAARVSARDPPEPRKHQRPGCYPFRVPLRTPSGKRAVSEHHSWKKIQPWGESCFEKRRIWRQSFHSWSPRKRTGQFKGRFGITKI